MIGLIILPTGSLISMAFVDLDTALACAAEWVTQDDSMNQAFYQVSDTEFVIDLCLCHDVRMFVSEVPVYTSETAPGLEAGKE